MNASNRFNIEMLASQHQAEIEKELAMRHLLQGVRPNAPVSMRVAVRIVSIAIPVISLILLIFAR